MGASVGLALARAGIEVLLQDRDPEALAEAVSVGAGVARTPASPPPALVVVAVPPSAAGAALDLELRRWPKATVTDLTSVKAVPIAQALALAGDPARLVGGHPMAGREVSGPGAARADLFDDRLWVLTPTAETDPARLASVVALVETCGGLPLVLDPASHDRAVALTSHTPQLLASLLAARLAEADEGDVAVSGQGLRDVTRVAGSDPVLWTEILGANAGPVADILDRLASDLVGVRDALRSAADLNRTGADASVPLEAVTAVLRAGNEGRARVPDKHGGRGAAEYVVVPVVIADRAGQLGRLFAVAGEAGVSIEDVRIEHTVGRLAAVVELSVVPGAAAALTDALEVGGWTVRA
jgi:prephenate dehydrogenase